MQLNFDTDVKDKKDKEKEKEKSQDKKKSPQKKESKPESSKKEETKTKVETKTTGPTPAPAPEKKDEKLDNPKSFIETDGTEIKVLLFTKNGKRINIADAQTIIKFGYAKPEEFEWCTYTTFSEREDQVQKAKKIAPFTVM